MAGLHKLTPAFVAGARDGKITTPRRYGDGGGLYLKVGASGRASWVFAYGQDGKQTLMGGGSVQDVSLRAARDWAAEQRQLRSNGSDPLAARQRQRQAEALARNRGVTFEAAARRYIAAFEASWRNPKHRQQWSNTLATYVFPVFGNKPVAAIETADVMRAIEPIWAKKPETASRVRGRIEVILDWARTQGLRKDESNPARWRGHLAFTLPAKSKLRAVKHHAAVPVDDLPKVFAKLGRSTGVAAAAVRFCLLTAARPGEVAGVTWDEVNVEAGCWTVSPARHKTGKPHRVPLSAPAIALLNTMQAVRQRGDQRVFPGGKRNAFLSLTSLSKALSVAGGGEATVHGSARSTFDDWASERTSYAPKLVDRALGHGPKSQTIAAYRRSELYEQRKPLMADWARYLNGH